MDADEKILREGRYIIRPVTVGSLVGRKSDTFGARVLTSVCPFIQVTAYIVLKYHIIVIILLRSHARHGGYRLEQYTDYYII